MSDPTPPSKEDLPDEPTSPGGSNKEPSRKNGSTAKAEDSPYETESTAATHDKSRADEHEDSSILSPPCSAELPPAFSPSAACTGSSIPTTSASGAVVFSGGQETAGSQTSLLVAGSSHQAGKHRLDRSQEEPEVLEWSSALGPAEKALSQSNGEIPTESGVAGDRDEALLQSETVQHEVGICRTASPHEYHYDIPKAEFSRESRWEARESYTKGNLDLETKVSLLTDVTQPTQNRTTSAVILLTVQDRKPEHEYEARTTVILYDEKAGQILKESTEIRRLEERKNYVKFMVDLGLHQDIEKSRGKKLQLQVKVRVDEKGTYKTYWEMLMVSCSVKR